ncbi:MAG: hydrogenase subunit MbhD domain-containing protein [Chloroflexota bacterium]
MENIYYLFLFLIAAFCAYRAMISTHLLPSTLYLAGVSALMSVVLYMLGAYEVAVIELSVGAGLVTVLLVYALSVIGDDVFDPTSIIPKPLAFVLVGAIAAIVGWMAYPIVSQPAVSGEVLLAEVLWKQRALDVWVQVALIFSGVMGVLGLLSEKAHPAEAHETQPAVEGEPIAIQIEQEIHA